MKFILRLIVISLLLNTNLIADDRPNILFLFGDDHAYDSIGLSSDGYVKTPTIDKLASQGLYFERAYNMGSWTGAVCVASRTMLNTGQTIWKSQRWSTKKRGKAGENNSEEHPSWSQRMQSAGYETFFAGKWHVPGYDPKMLFDHFGTIRPGMPVTKGDHNRPIRGKQDEWSPSDPKHGGYWAGGKHWSEVTADETIEYLNQKALKKDNKPFFAYIAFNAPHDPRQSPQEYLDLYPTDSVPLPKSYMPSYEYTKEIGVWSIRAESLAPRPRTEFAVRTHRKEYYALISHLDAQLGRIVSELDILGLSENTIIIYTSDHGLSLGNHSFFAKQSMYDHSLASPLIIAGPGLPKGVRSKQRIYIQDIVPTTLELAGLSVEKYSDVEFKSFLQVTKDGLGEVSRPIFAGYKNLSRSVIRDDWKLIYYPNLKKYRLFNLKADPNELNDESNDPEHQKLVQSLIYTLIEQQQILGDELIIPVADVSKDSAL